MLRTTILLASGLFIGAGLGLYGANNLDIFPDETQSAVSQMQMQGHDHSSMQVVSLPNDGTAPVLASITLHKDAVSGWNLELKTANFRFAPEHASQDNIAGEGHAHVYLNGEKLARLYSNWMHIATLPAGQNTITASLYANDHSPLMVAGNKLEARTMVSVQ